MSDYKSVVLNFAIVVLIAFPGIAAPNVEPLIEHPSVRLARPSIGCGSFEDLKRVADEVVGAAGSDFSVRSGDCRPFQTIHGEIIDKLPGAVCVLGLGNSRCIWFPEADVEPARRL